MDRINPLNEHQLKKLPQHLEPSTNPTRIMHNRKSVDITSGLLHGGNVMYQIVYWDRPKEFFDMVLDFLKENNPGATFRLER